MPRGPVEIPFCASGPGFAPDLEFIASAAGITPAETLARFCAGDYHVEFMGFAPGFAYLGGLDPALHVPRLDTPRPRIEPGSVAVAGPRDFCHNTKNNRVYVANYFADSVTVIDGVTDQILAVIPVGDGPRALAYNSQNNRIYCANEFSGNVTVIDGVTNAVIATVPVGSTPRVICYNPVSNKVYVPNAGSQTVSIINGSTNTVLATVPVGTVPRGILFNPQNT